MLPIPWAHDIQTLCPSVLCCAQRVISRMQPASPALREELRAVFAMVQRREHEHAEALALLNRLSPNPPTWARDAVAEAWRIVLAVRAAERRALERI